MATKSSIHIKPCRVTSSGAHNRRTTEYMRNIGKSQIYIIPELTSNNEQWINPGFGSGKLKDLEQANEKLRQEVAKRDKSIDELKNQMQQMQEQHGKQIRNLQGIHNQELEAKDREISQLNTLLEKAHKWFPMFKEMLRMEKLCAVIGFTKDMIESLLTKKEAIQCSGKIYSEEHRRKFGIKNDIFRVEKIQPITINLC